MRDLIIFAVGLGVALGVSAYYLLPQFWTGELGDPDDPWTRKIAGWWS